MVSRSSSPLSGGFEFVVGDKEIARLLGDLEANVSRKIMVSAISMGNSEVVKGIRAEIPTPKTGSRAALRKRIGKSKVRVVRKKGVAKAGVGVGRPRIARGDSGGWLNLLAIGTSQRMTKNGRLTGRVIADDFVPRGARRSGAAAQRKMRLKALAMFKKETAKLARKHKTRRSLT
jgi:hypothetical protein